jgi:DNA-binding NarL/FixJ family response regulator
MTPTERKREDAAAARAKVKREKIEEQRRRALELLATGVSRHQISLRLGISNDKVRLLLKP